MSLCSQVVILCLLQPPFLVKTSISDRDLLLDVDRIRQSVQHLGIRRKHSLMQLTLGMLKRKSWLNRNQHRWQLVKQKKHCQLLQEPLLDKLSKSFKKRRRPLKVAEQATIHSHLWMFNSKSVPKKEQFKTSLRRLACGESYTMVCKIVMATSSGTH